MSQRSDRLPASREGIKEFCMLKKRRFGIIPLAAAVMLVCALIGCGDNGDPANPAGGSDKPPAGPGTGGDPQSNPGEIWKDDATPNEGLRFENATVYRYIFTGNRWGNKSPAGTWSGSTITKAGGGANFTFTVRDDKLYEYGPSGRLSAAYTKITRQIISN
jgi:hypothetical protein